MDRTPLYNEYVLQAALANVFCYLVSSMDDENVQVAQRATLYLGTVHDKAIKSLVGCLETQFDTVIVDRPVVLQVCYHSTHYLMFNLQLSNEFVSHSCRLCISCITASATEKYWRGIFFWVDSTPCFWRLKLI